VRFLLDTQLPKALARKLRNAGHEVEHVLELAMGQSPDNDLWQYAIEHQAVIVSKDEDFADWVLAGRPGPAVIWLRVGNCTNAELMEWLLPLWPQVLEALERGDHLVEIA
jgi:predicted nuclease of predicted toxin-antitoxin system